MTIIPARTREAKGERGSSVFRPAERDEPADTAHIPIGLRYTRNFITSLTGGCVWLAQLELTVREWSRERLLCLRVIFMEAFLVDRHGGYRYCAILPYFGPIGNAVTWCLTVSLFIQSEWISDEG